MQTQFGRGRYVDIIVNRGLESGGSVGGNKKAGIVNYGPTWSRGNMGNFLIRAPATTPTLQFMLTHTTRHPWQYRRGSYASTHSGTLG